MPRKPMVEKQTINVVVNGQPVAVILHPPAGTRSSWYAYWQGLTTSRSTGQRNLQEAIVSAENMVRAGAGGRRATLSDVILSDEEFERVQRAHYTRKSDPAAAARAAKTLGECLDAIDAFKSISGLCNIATATADDCAQFQRAALRQDRQWRTVGRRTEIPESEEAKKRRPSKSKARRFEAGVPEPVGRLIQPNTVLKWSRALQAAFERVNRSAGKKCVRGVVPEAKLLSSNPWSQFTWIEGTEKAIDHFDAGELLGFLRFLETDWAQVPVAALATKVLLWSCCRRSEAAGLRWEDVRSVQGQVHFEIVGKWGVERWFRIPEQLYREMLSFETASPFVFAAYGDQIAQVYSENKGCLKRIKSEFEPQNFGRWLYERLKDWAVTQPRGSAYLHVFRKTGLQFAHDAEEDEASKRVADDAGVTEQVLLGHYVKPKLWRQSNRTYRRLLASFPPEVAAAYGYQETERSRVERQLGSATDSGNWHLVRELAERLRQMDEVDRQHAG